MAPAFEPHCPGIARDGVRERGAVPCSVAAVRRGLSLPIFDELADPATLAALAVRAEQRGWDGVFLWDHVIYRAPVTAATDPWIALAAIAAATERIELGPMVTPLARRRPWIVARQAVALDQLSGGRFVLGVGLGLDSSGGELSRFGEQTDDRARAAMLDEGLDVLTGLLSNIVVYFSDNGPNSWRWNGGMKGRKGTTDEGGVRSPLLVHKPRPFQPTFGSSMRPSSPLA